ncbi:prephenate dehydrogenase [Anaerosinus gibii]|uniref:Prephenate dehydrogenase n=1 Tax=Selenobaculum gibii TaxID=3054208 RepID=A0A9Y2ERV4_9FIRM|nr:prephenate dehydrogenase/arogenate dehydrogenase family protein [Selenobaculum gbiensis]WIW71627.1 prephenate dehydrogenase/arogenate dehydrogenase family protein [Selenobaculum gbiensis]
MSELKICIVGIGLIGGSIGLALKKELRDKVCISGLDKNRETLRIAVERGAVDMATSDYAQAVKDADIIFFSTPVLQIGPMVEKILPFIKSGAVITDTGSTKQFIWQQLRKILPPDIYYVAGHPMAGKEHSGIKAADANLFKNKCYVIVEDTGAPRKVVHKICSILKLTGANITTLDIAKHDRCASIISHVPHVTAAALVTLLNHNKNDIEANLKLAGGGFKDTTRIASSNADMWADICMSNPEAIMAHLEELKEIIDTVIIDIKNKNRENIYDYFYEAKERRDKILDKTHNLFEI